MNIIMLVTMPYVSVPKFSPFISTKAAEASSPTTPGRNPLNTAATDGCFWYFRKNLLIIIMRINEGSTTEHVATAEPSIPVACEYPAFTTAVYPTYVAEFIPMGPGVIWLIATMSVNSDELSQSWRVTTSPCIIDSMAYPPPKPKSPILKNV